tara:strand:- start:1979 stop:2356 length:378 start_codon:yes stop_codon:yes gene_type:complete
MQKRNTRKRKKQMSPVELVQTRLPPPHLVKNYGIRQISPRKNTSRKYSSLKKKLSSMGFQNEPQNEYLIKDIIRYNKNNNKDDLFNILFDINILKPKSKNRSKKAVSFARPKSFKIKKHNKHYSI